MWKIGNVKIDNQVVLAPMAGVSNPSFMKIAEEMGAGLVVTELISSEALVRGNKKTLEMLNGLYKINIPVSVQLFGSNAKVMAKAANVILNKFPKVKIIDLNMGCPVPKVAIKNQAGSALLKDPEKIREIVSAVVKSVNVPVTVKIRSGWDEQSINAPLVAKIIEESGASAITIHARTRSQGYGGKANWQIIKEVKEKVKIPVIGNGDIRSCYDAQKMIEETNCDAVMIGRGVMGNPWLIRETVAYLKDKSLPQEVTPKEKIEMLKKHYALLLDNTNPKEAILEIRMHALWYIKGLPNSANIKKQICETKKSEDLFKVLDTYLNEL